jgi:hypothetical protein
MSAEVIERGVDGVGGTPPPRWQKGARTARGLSVGCLMFALVASLAVADGASAGRARAAAPPACSFDPESRTLAVRAPGINFSKWSQLTRVGDEIAYRQLNLETSRSHFIACSGGPTVNNTDTIAVSSGAALVPEFSLDLGGGPFAPGATPEADGSSEIEFAVDLSDADCCQGIDIRGTTGADAIRIGGLREGSGVNLNASEPEPDADVTFLGRPELLVFGGRGSDQISANGGPGFRGPYERGSIIEGGPGADRLVGADFFDWIYPGRGRDQVRTLDGPDVVSARDGTRDVVRCGSGKDEIRADGHDRYGSCEAAIVKPAKRARPSP